MSMWDVLGTITSHDQHYLHLIKRARLACERADAGRWISMSDASGTTSGRKDSECGAMGVSSVLGTLGATMGPPALSEYAVDPDGVAMIRPSACAPGAA